MGGPYDVTKKLTYDGGLQVSCAAMGLVLQTNSSCDLLLFFALANVEVEYDMHTREGPLLSFTSELFPHPRDGDSSAEDGPHPRDAPP